jgi:hypothetical protein
VTKLCPQDRAAAVSSLPIVFIAWLPVQNR